jgi:chorismate--pyruvate lyase
MYGWCPVQGEKLQTTPTHLHDWLVKPYRLARALARHTPEIHLHLLKQEHTTLPTNEAELLHASTGLIRQIYLTDGKKPLTYGRTVIPQNTVDAYAEHFAQLGNKPIGDTLLYDNPAVTREPFEFGYVASGSALFSCATSENPMTVPCLWGRRSMFSLAGFPLLITELFFPDLPAYINE